MKHYCRDCEKTFNVGPNDALPEGHAFYENTNDLIEIDYEITRQNERTFNYPGKINAQELEQVRTAASALNLSPAAYVRKRLKLPSVSMGAPKGNKNAKKQ